MKKIIVGIDFDGVVAYNPARIARLPVTIIKKKLLNTKGTKFYIPRSSLEKFIWTLLHETSVFPSIGTSYLKELVRSKKIEAHLVTARYSFLQKGLYSWLHRNDMTDVFRTITMNEHDEQPHVYKARIIQEKKFDYFIEDNLDIVRHVTKTVPTTEVLWIYNLLDYRYPYDKKFPYLEKALRAIPVATKDRSR